MRPNRLSHIYDRLSHIIIIWKSSTNTVLFVNATIGFSENLFLVFICCEWTILTNLNSLHVLR